MNHAQVTIENTGAAPIYYDAYVSVNGVQAVESLKYLRAGASRQFLVEAGGEAPVLKIECDRLVPGQMIEYEANLD